MIVRSFGEHTNKGDKALNTDFCNTLLSRGGTRVHSQLPNECDYLRRVLEFMAIIFVIIEISSALWTQKNDETATIIQRQRIFENTSQQD